MERMEKAFAPLEEYIEKTTDTALTEEGKKQLLQKVEETKKKIGTPLAWDKWIYRMVVGFLGLAILSALFFTFWLFLKSTNPKDLQIPDIFLAIGSAAVGALAGLLAPSPARGSDE
jgi:hypothetical protein